MGWVVIGMKVAAFVSFREIDGAVFYRLEKKHCFALAWPIYFLSSLHGTLNGNFVFVRQVWLLSGGGDSMRSILKSRREESVLSRLNMNGSNEAN